MIGCSSSSPQNVDAHATPGQRRRVDHRSVDADAQVAAAGRRDDAAEAGAEAARHRRLERELRRDVTLRAQRPDRLEHRRRAARVDDGVGVCVELCGEQLGDEAVMADRAVVGGDRARRTAARRRRRGRRRGSRAAPSPPPPARRARSPAARSRPRRRTGSPGARRAGATNPRPSGPVSHSPSPGSEAHSRAVPGPTSSSRNCSPSGPSRRTDSARARNGRSSSPPPQSRSAASM